MAKIISVGSALPPYRYDQAEALDFMDAVLPIPDDVERRKLRFLYRQSGIQTRYSVLPDWRRDPDADWILYDKEKGFEASPTLEDRMCAFAQCAPPLTQAAAEACLSRIGAEARSITHLLTVSCTGLAAPGLELDLMERMGLSRDLHRTGINFMGCYAAVHALKQAAAIADADPQARVLIVCTELCMLHFQRRYDEDSVAASLLFADGSAAALVTGDTSEHPGLRLDTFYAELLPAGRKDMAWTLSSSGFIMTLSGYVPDLVQADIGRLKDHALQRAGIRHEDVRYWCIHPGGKRILQAVARSLELTEGDLACSYKVLREHGNMSSCTLLHVLEEQWDAVQTEPGARLFGVAFGPGLTMESFIGTAV